MKMSIDKSLEWLISRKEHYELDDNCQELAQALDVAIETMHKYQKIADLYDYWRSGKCEYTISCMENIGKVLREGMMTDNLCDSCTNIGCEFQSGIVRTKCNFYMPPHIEPDNCGNYVVMQPTVEAIPKADIQKAIDKVENYICDYETNTVKAQGMCKAIEIFEQALKERGILIKEQEDGLFEC